jgi:hypothetical protein
MSEYKKCKLVPVVAMMPHDGDQNYYVYCPQCRDMTECYPREKDLAIGEWIVKQGGAL